MVKEKMSREDQAEMIKRLMLADDEFMDLILGIMDLDPNIQLALDDLVKACNEKQDSPVDDNTPAV